MKTQKVEIELLYFEGYEFLKYGIVDKKHETDFYYVYSPYLERLVCVKDNNSFFKQLHLIYRKKVPRKIIYEEVREDHLKRGDFYRDEFGDVNMWISDMQSREKYTILKKVHDDFNCDEDVES